MRDWTRIRAYQCDNRKSFTVSPDIQAINPATEELCQTATVGGVADRLPTLWAVKISYILRKIEMDRMRPRFNGRGRTAAGYKIPRGEKVSAGRAAAISATEEARSQPKQPNPNPK